MSRLIHSINSCDFKTNMPTKPSSSTVKNIVVLISGGGTNLQAIIDAVATGQIKAQISAVISNKDEAYGLERAKKANIKTESLSHKAFDSREEFDVKLAELIENHSPDILVLAGFMRILTPDFVRKFQGKMINIHPSLLPKFQGLHTHQRAIDAKESEHGASVHYVTEELDGGPVIIQGKVPVLANDTAEILANRVLQEEHRIFPLAVQWMVEDRVSLESGNACLDGKPVQTEPSAHAIE